MKEKTERTLNLWKKYKYVALIILIGVIFLVWPDGKPQEPVQVRAVESTQTLSRQLEEILTHMAGVGQVQVLLTTENDGQRQLAQDVTLRYSGDAASPEQYERSSETILKGGNDEPMIVKNQYPVYRGALVVCQGGDQPEVKLAVTEAVASLTGLRSDRVSVAKWQ